MVIVVIVIVLILKISPAPYLLIYPSILPSFPPSYPPKILPSAPSLLFPLTYLYLHPPRTSPYLLPLHHFPPDCDVTTTPTPAPTFFLFPHPKLHNPWHSFGRVTS